MNAPDKAGDNTITMDEYVVYDKTHDCTVPQKTYASGLKWHLYSPKLYYHGGMCKDLHLLK